MELTEVKEKISELEREIAKKFEDLKAGRLNEADFQERVEKLDKKIIELERAMAEVKKPGVQVVDKAEKTEELKVKAFKKYLRMEALEPEEKKALVVGTPEAGGYLAPKEWAAEVDRNLTLFSPIRSVARVVTTSMRSLLVPRLTNMGSAAITGEGGTITPTDMTFDQIEITPFKMTRAVQISRELLRDNAFNLEGMLAELFGEMFGKTEGTQFVTAVITPTTGATIYTTGASTLAADDIVTAYHKVAQPYSQMGTWAMNRNTLLAIRLMKNVTNGAYVFVPDMTGATPGTILGRPIIECPDYADIAAGAIVATFGDWKTGFWIVDRQGIEVLVADQLYAANDLVGFFATKRTGGAVIRSEALVNVKIKDN